MYSSQRVLERQNGNITIELNVQLNFELEQEILNFGDGMIVLAPAWLGERIRQKFKAGSANHEAESPDDSAS